MFIISFIMAYQFNSRKFIILIKFKIPASVPPPPRSPRRGNIVSKTRENIFALFLSLLYYPSSLILLLLSVSRPIPPLPCFPSENQDIFVVREREKAQERCSCFISVVSGVYKWISKEGGYFTLFFHLGKETGWGFIRFSTGIAWLRGNKCFLGDLCEIQHVDFRLRVFFRIILLMGFIM